MDGHWENCQLSPGPAVAYWHVAVTLARTWPGPPPHWNCGTKADRFSSATDSGQPSGLRGLGQLTGIVQRRRLGGLSHESLKPELELAELTLRTDSGESSARRLRLPS